MLKVCEKKCDQCLFSKNRIVSKERVKEILSDCNKEDTYFTCHKGTIKGEEIVCKGFFDADKKTNRTAIIRVAKFLGVIKFVKP